VKSVLITGCSSGIGAACASRLAAEGWQVLAGVRKPGAAPVGTTEVLLDVTDPASIQAAAEGVERLDALVNNAGIAVAAPLEFLPLEELRRQFEVNVVGQLAVTQAFLPPLRRAKGRIVNIGSIAGRSALPFLGSYAVSKFALEALTDALRVELRPDGIEVSIVQPGTIATPIWTKPQPVADALPEEARERYGPRVDAMRAFANARAAKAAPPDAVAAAVVDALTAWRPRPRYMVGRDAHIRAALERLPTRVRDMVLSRILFRELKSS
jgi:NAD(P)-dependent dehydrogenase (short-subunit alcohol dehydrogenase family)